MRPEADRALARIKAARRRVTAVEIRCAPRGQHLMASLHPSGPRWLLWRRGGRVANAGFQPVDESPALLWPAPQPAAGLWLAVGTLACRCTARNVDEEISDLVWSAVAAWRAAGSTKTQIVLLESPSTIHIAPV